MYKVLLFLLVLLSVSCNQCNKASEQRNTSSSDSIKPEKKDSVKLDDLPWITAIDPKTGNTHLQHLPAKSADLTPQQIVEAANKKYPQIKLQWIKKEGNTAYLKINDATYLTQSIGSAGAEAYLSEITYSFTEVEGINSIHLQFPEGDHASPGVYTREQFKNLEK